MTQLQLRILLSAYIPEHYISEAIEVMSKIAQEFKSIKKQNTLLKRQVEEGRRTNKNLKERGLRSEAKRDEPLYYAIKKVCYNVVAHLERSNYVLVFYRHKDQSFSCRSGNMSNIGKLMDSDEYGLVGRYTTSVKRSEILNKVMALINEANKGIV